MPDLTRPSVAPAPLFCKVPLKVPLPLPSVNVAEVPAAVLSTTLPAPSTAVKIGERFIVPVQIENCRPATA